MISSLSFCIMAVRRRDEAVNRLIASIRKQGVPEFEIFVAGRNQAPADGTTYFYRSEWPQGPSIPWSEIQNEFCKRATKDYIVLLDADIELTPDWYSSVRTCNAYDIFGSQLTNRKGKRAMDWAHPQQGNEKAATCLLDYDEWAPKAFVSGALMLIRRGVWQHVEFDEEVGACGGEDMNFCHRASAMGFRIGICPKAIAIHHAARGSESLPQKLKAILEKGLVGARH